MSLLERVDTEWDEFKAKARARWGQLQDTDWDEIERTVEGRWNRFTERVRHYHDKSAAEVKEQVEAFMGDGPGAAADVRDDAEVVQVDTADPEVASDR